jgi:hypothetical protein
MTPLAPATLQSEIITTAWQHGGSPISRWRPRISDGAAGWPWKPCAPLFRRRGLAGPSRDCRLETGHPYSTERQTSTGVDGPDDASFALAAPAVQLGALKWVSLMQLSQMCELDDPPVVAEGVHHHKTEPHDTRDARWDCRLPVPWDHPVARSMGPPRAPQRPAGVMIPAVGRLVKRAVAGASAEPPLGPLRWPAFPSGGGTRLL